MIERTADICVNNETCQNNLIKNQDTLSKAYQNNLKNLTDTEIFAIKFRERYRFIKKKVYLCSKID